MYPPYNKPTIDRTPLGKGACPPSANSGQVPESKEGKLTKVLPEPRIRLKKGTITRSPFPIWLPGVDEFRNFLMSEELDFMTEQLRDF